MIRREHVPLRELTTLRVGGAARHVLECSNIEEVIEAISFAKERDLPFFVVGGGSNLLAADAGYDGVIIAMRSEGMIFTDSADETVLCTAAAGTDWNQLVDAACSRGLWGIENLAGIPGTAGAAPVQNIGAYGAELADTLESVEALDASTGTVSVLAKDACGLGYRDSRFKHDANLVILSVTLRLRKEGEPRIGYKDMTAYVAEHDALETPAQIAEAVRAIRAKKFPDLRAHGTAGSFFKNPTISADAHAALVARYPELPGYVVEGGVKLPLAWILDHVLDLRGYRDGAVYCFPTQPLVIVTDDGATSHDVEAFADSIARRVHDVSSIDIEREVRSLK